MGESPFTRMMRIGFGDGTVCPNSEPKRQRNRVLVSGTHQQSLDWILCGRDIIEKTKKQKQNKNKKLNKSKIAYHGVLHVWVSVT